MKIYLSIIFSLLLAHDAVSDDIPSSEIILPELGDRVSGAVSAAQERAIGEMFLEQIYSQAPLISDPLLFDYTEHLIYRLSEFSQVDDRYFNVLLIDDSSLNAFAAPGGIIGVNGGLFLNADNEGQFASVIAHELAHLSQRHFARNVLKSQDSNLASALVMVSSIAIALISNNPNAISVGPAFLQQQNLRYSRLFEKEADRVGFANLVKAGYNPKSMGEMFENMNDIRRLSGDLPPEFLLTHPLSSSRISDAFNAAEGISDEGKKSDSLEFGLMKTRLEVYYEKIPANALRSFQAKVNDNPSDANIYGLALAHEKNSNFDKSLSLLNNLIEKYPKNLVINTTKVDVLLSNDEFKRALTLVDRFLEISPKNYPLSISKSKVLLAMKKYFESEEIIRDQLLRRNDDPELWLLLSEIQRSSQNIIGYHQSRAEYFLLLGQDEQALNQLEFALQLTQNNFQVSESIMNKIVKIKKDLSNSRGL
ncbi:MAG: peptidase M48 [Gammaproteobacteria bacterium]|nr:peptidase M48 [Gammaproteobacteria bacterium]